MMEPHMIDNYIHYVFAFEFNHVKPEVKTGFLSICGKFIKFLLSISLTNLSIPSEFFK
jgi:hypothetical protein